MQRKTELEAKQLVYKDITIVHSGEVEIKDADTPIELTYRAIPLIIAIQTIPTDKKLITAYLNATKNVNIPDSHGKTALAHAVSRSPDFDDIIIELLGKDADPSHASVQLVLTQMQGEIADNIKKLKAPFSKLKPSERAKCQDAFARYYRDQNRLQESLKWRLIGAQNGGLNSMWHIALNLIERADELSLLKAIFWLELQCLKWSEKNDQNEVVALLKTLSESSIPKIVFRANMALARIHLIALYTKKPHALHDPERGEEYFNKALAYFSESKISRREMLIELYKLRAAILTKFRAEYTKAAQLGDLLAAHKAYTSAQPEEKKDIAKHYITAAKAWQYEEFIANIPHSEREPELKEISKGEAKDADDKTVQNLIEWSKKSIWDAHFNAAARKYNYIPFLREQLINYSNATDEKETLKEWFLWTINSSVTNTNFSDEVAPLLFEEKPPIIELRKALIDAAKKQAKSKEDAIHQSALSTLISLELETTNTLLKKRSEERSQLIVKQIELITALTKNEEKDFKPYITKLTKLADEPSVKSNIEQMQKITRMIAVLKFRQYEIAPPEYSDVRKEELQAHAKDNVFFAVTELDKESKGVHMFTRQEYVGRHLYLAMKARLLVERGLVDFPDRHDLINGIKADKLEYLNKWAKESSPPDLSYPIIAKWYIALLDTVIPSLNRSDKPLDQEMLTLLKNDPDAFLLKAVDIYAKQHVQQKELEIIAYRSRQDMKKALGDDQAYVNKKDQIKLQHIESGKKQTDDIKKEQPEIKKTVPTSTSVEMKDLKTPSAIARPKAAIAPSAPVFAESDKHAPHSEIKYDEESSRISNDLYLSALTLLSSSPLPEDKVQANKLLERWQSKLLPQKDPHYKYYVTAQWYLSLINFILPTLDLQISDFGEFLKSAPTKYAQQAQEYLPANALTYVNVCLQEALKALDSGKKVTRAYPQIASASTGDFGLFSPPRPAVTSEAPVASSSLYPSLSTSELVG